MVHAHVFHDDVQRLFRMLGRPFPAPAAGVGKLLRLLLVVHIVVVAHVHAVLLDIVLVVAEAVHAGIVELHAALHQLVEFIVRHGEGRVDGTLYEEVDGGRSRNPVVVEVLPVAQAEGQLAETGEPAAHPGPLLGQRVNTPAGDDNHGIVHRRLEDVHQRHVAADDFQCLAKLQGGRLALVLEDTAQGRLGGGGMDDIHIQPGITVEAQFLGHIVPGELRLRRPLRREDEALLGTGGEAGHQPGNRQN